MLEKIYRARFDPATVAAKRELWNVLVEEFLQRYVPTDAVVVDIGGGRFSNCSMLEAVQLCEEIAGKKSDWTYSESNRSGDHIWWISDVSKFKSHYPEWDFKYGVQDMLEQIHAKIVRDPREELESTNEL